MENNKTPGTDGLTKEFYETFWNEIKCFSEGTKTCYKKRTIKYFSTSRCYWVNRKKDREKKVHYAYFFTFFLRDIPSVKFLRFKS